MKDLGKLQTLVWTKIKDAIGSGDSASFRILGQIADEMDRKHDEWQRLLDNGTASTGTREAPTSGPPPDGHGVRATIEDEDFSGRSIHAFELAGQKIPVGSYKELLLEVSRILQEQDLNRFETVAPQIRGRGAYFSNNADDLRLSRKLPRGRLFIETNMNANLIVTVCRRLAEAFGENLKLDVAPVRTRKQKRFDIIAEETEELV